MKNKMKFVVLTLLAALLFLPFQAAQAQGLGDGPFLGESIILESGETFDGDLLVVGGSVTIKEGATVNGSVLLIGGSLTADGEVRGDVVVLGGSVSLDSNAHIAGNLLTAGAPVYRAEGARIDGGIYNDPKKPPAVTTPNITITPELPRPQFVLNRALGFVEDVFSLFIQSLGLGLLAALLVLFLPQQMRRVGEAVPVQPAWAGLMGLGSLLLFVTAIVALALFSVLVVTLLLTVPLMIAIVVIFAAAAIFGWAGLGTEIGLRLSTVLKTEVPLPLSTGVGTFLLHLIAGGVGMIPCVGWMIPTILGLISLGAVFLTRFGTRALSMVAIPTIAETPPTVETH